MRINIVNLSAQPEVSDELTMVLVKAATAIQPYIKPIPGVGLHIANALYTLSLEAMRIGLVYGERVDINAETPQ